MQEHGKQAQEEQRANERIPWMDTLRGIAVGLVILDHSADLVTHNMRGLPSIVTAVNDAVSPFRMATLVFVSGMLLPTSMRKRGHAYLIGKFRRIGWPYLIWSFLLVSLLVATAGTTGREEGLSTYVRIFFYPPTYLWYLFYLLIYYIAALAFRRVPWSILAGAGLAISLVTPDAYPAFGRFWYLFALFFLGAVAQAHLQRWDALLQNTAFQVVAVVLSAATIAMALNGWVVRYQAEFIWGALAGIVVLTLASRALASRGFGRLLADSGKQSIIYYCTHWSAILVSFHVLHRLGLNNVTILFAAALMAGVGISMVMVLATRCWPVVNWLYEWKPARRPLSV